MTYFPKELTKELVEQLKDFGLDKRQAEQIVEIEMLIVGVRMMDPYINPDEAWAVLIGYDEPITKKHSDKTLLAKLRLFFPHFKLEREWLASLDTYFLIDKKYRLYQKEGQIIEEIPSIASDRLKTYYQVLKAPLERKIRNEEFASPGLFSYTRRVETNSVTYVGELPEHIQPLSSLPSYKEKIDCSFNLNIDWTAIAQEMEEHAKTVSYVERVRKIEFSSLHSSKRSKFRYRGTQHIVGGLGSGKSTWMVLETYHQVTRKNAKVGFIESSVARVLERVQELQQLGLKAVPVIGKGNRLSHENLFLASNIEKDSGVSQFLESKHRPLRSVSDRCTLKALTDDHERNNYYPCKSINQKNKKFLCPLASTCGVYEEWTELAEADIWVATPASLIDARLPAVVDPLERTIFEAMYDLLDIVFVDESDAVQQQLDREFLVEVSAFGKQDAVLEKILVEEKQMITGRYNDFAGNKLISKWKSNLSELERSIWPLFEKVKHNPKLSDYLKREMIFSGKLAFKLAKKLTKEDSLQEKVEKQLKDFAYNPRKDTQLSSYFQKLFEEEADKKLILRKICKNVLNVEMDSDEDILNELELFFYFSYVDYNIRFLLSYYPAVQNQLGTGFDFSPLLTKSKEYKPFLLEAMTGMLIGYRYEETNGEKLGHFKLIEYSGIGRKLLYDWHNLYESAFQKKGPAVVMLSGTSLAPGSDHYNIEAAPQWLIRSEQPKSVITQSYLPMFDLATGEKLFVSGKHKTEREINLRKVIIELKNRLLSEMLLLDEEKRRILLVVNSYEDAEAAAEALESLSELRNNYRVLTKGMSSIKHSFPRNQIEDFSYENEKILVVPLMAVSRGYNILNGQNEALFGSVFFLVRPYPIPNDFPYIIQVLHAAFPVFMKKIDAEGLRYSKAVKKLRSMSISHFEQMYKKPDFWAVLTEKEREVLSWYIFIPVWQMIGRLLRGGKNARVYYCDGSFHHTKSNKPSLLEYWKNNLTKYQDDKTMNDLYGPFITSMEDIFKEERGLEDERTSSARI